MLAVTNEYSTGMIRVTFTAIPRRLEVLAAKATIVAGLSLLASTVAVAASLVIGRIVLDSHGFTVAHGYPALSLTHAATLRAAAGSVLYVTLIALLSLGAAAAVRDTATAIGTILGVLYLFPILAHAVSDPALAEASRSDQPYERRNGDPRHRKPPQPRGRPLDRARSPRRVGRRRPRHRRTRPGHTRRVDRAGIQLDLDLLQHWEYPTSVSKETSGAHDALLRRHGLQVTAQRLAVLRAVSDRPHSTADDIYKAVRAEIGAISRQAVYDALAALTDKGTAPAHPARPVARPLRGPGR